MLTNMFQRKGLRVGFHQYVSMQGVGSWCSPICFNAGGWVLVHTNMIYVAGLVLVITTMILCSGMGVGAHQNYSV